MYNYESKNSQWAATWAVSMVAYNTNTIVQKNFQLCVLKEQSYLHVWHMAEELNFALCWENVLLVK